MDSKKPIDIFITAYERQATTIKTIEYIKARTHYPYRLILIDNGNNLTASNFVDYTIRPSKNLGIHAAWNMALALAESDYFITTDNDIFVPDLYKMAPMREEGKWVDSQTEMKDWLEYLVGYMDQRPNYGAISLHPHVFIGAQGIDPKEQEDVIERNMCGAVMRIMRRDIVMRAGGWDNIISVGRNHEERTICSRLQSIGYKVGITSRIRAFHPFPPNWGYPKEFTPEMQKHNPDLEEYVQSFGNIFNYDQKTWMPL